MCIKLLAILIVVFDGLLYLYLTQPAQRKPHLYVTFLRSLRLEHLPYPITSEGSQIKSEDVPPSKTKLCANYASNRLKRTCLESIFPLCSLLLQPFSLCMTQQMISPTDNPTLHIGKEDI